MTTFFHFNLTKDLSSILEDSDDYNVIIQVGETNNTKEFRAHSVILRARSSYFKGALSSNWIEKKDNMIMFNKPNVTPIVFDMILRYIYTSELDLTKQSGENILELLIASDELLLEELFEFVQDYLILKQTSWIYQNFANPLPFITSKSFLSIDKDILHNLLSRDDLQVKEIAIWDCLIQWGIEQTPDLESDRTNWNNENYEALEKNIANFFLLIRYAGISREDIVDKVFPYKAIIPKFIYKEIEKYYHKGTFPSLAFSSLRKIKIKSNIIESELVKQNGINNNSIKNKCNGRVASLVLIKTKQSNIIFGGYSSIGLNSLGDNYIVENNLRYYSSSDNFIFTFENGSDTRNMRIGRVVNESKAILVRGDHGFNFGQGSLCVVNHNLYLNNFKDNYNNILSTEIIYNIEEIETFIVEKF
ncbi:unnamed protein product [Rhizophagus irregularis]|nr:unnamed protein product [Rhizophagus irregularis]